MIICEKCGVICLKPAARCPQCGAKFPVVTKPGFPEDELWDRKREYQRKQSRRRTLITLGVLCLVVLAVIGAVISLHPRSEADTLNWTEIQDNTERLAEQNAASIMAVVSEYENAGDDYSLVEYLQMIASTDPSYQPLLEQYEQRLVQTTLETASTLAAGRDFEGAVAEIAKVQALCDSQALRDAAAAYADCLPKNLTDCYVIEKSDFDRAEIGAFTDSFGHSHEQALHLQTYDSVVSYIVFNLERNYVKLSMNLVHGDAVFDDPTVVRVYCDDQLVYTSPQIENTTEELPVELDITGVRVLRIEGQVPPTGGSINCSNVVIDASVS